MATDNAPANGNARNGRRLRAIAVVVTLFAIAGAGAAGWWWFVGRWTVSTDNAYVAGNIVPVTPRVSGTVVSVLADDTQFIEQGKPLVKLDDSDAAAQLEQAQAALAQAVRAVRGLYADRDQSSAAIAARLADLSRARHQLSSAEADAARARADYERRVKLAAQHFVSEENVQNAKLTWDAASAQERAAQSAVKEAQAALTQARSQNAASGALVDRTTLENHPRVMSAAASVREAYLALARTTIPAPVSGYVAKRSVQVGQRVAPGDALMSVIPPEQMWVEANFKEGELRKVRIGQPVTLTVDLYGGHIDFHGEIAGLASGTGSAFALLPAQNASGNWIRIVQRLPVRIRLRPDELAAHPLRIGLSTRVKVSVRDTSGPVLAPQSGTDTEYNTPIFTQQASDADALIARIIAENAS
jgi:membrane fusion protein (multidrug efflux system)